MSTDDGVVFKKESNKRSRASNMSKTELALLTDLAVKYAKLIENKSTDALSAKGKELAWQRLAVEFAASGGERREWHQLRNVSRISEQACYQIQCLLKILQLLFSLSEIITIMMFMCTIDGTQISKQLTFISDIYNVTVCCI